MWNKICKVTFSVFADFSHLDVHIGCYPSEARRCWVPVPKRNVDEERNKCGQKVELFRPDLYKAIAFKSMSCLPAEIISPANVDKKWTKCGRKVETMWTECGNKVARMWTKCGKKVAALCGTFLLLEAVSVPSSLQADHGHKQVQTIHFSKPPYSKTPVWAFLIYFLYLNGFKWRVLVLFGFEPGRKPGNLNILENEPF